MAETGVPNMKGQICWLEVPVSDVKRAAEFYSSVLEWTCDAEAEGKPSSLAGAASVHFFSKGVMNGAFLKMDDAAATGVDVKRSGAVTTFMVDDIEASLAKVGAAGGKTIVGKTAIGGDMGFFARFTDSEGNVQGLWAKA